VQLDTALNTIWLALSVLAFAGTLRALRVNKRTHGPAWFQVSVAAVILAALFPYVSATDDLLRIKHWQQPKEQLQQTGVHRHELHEGSSRDSASNKPADTLIRLYEMMDTPLAGPVPSSAFTFFFIALVVVSALPVFGREMTRRSGRSPPLDFA
jgi:hypothetical protein